MYYLKIYLSLLAVFFILDISWIGVMANSFYQKHLGYLLSPSPNWGVALLFYLIYLAGVLVFVVLPSAETDSWKHALLYGAFFGLVTYATYDLTNHATVKDWPWIVSVVDITWGTFLCSAISLAGYFAAKYFR